MRTKVKGELHKILSDNGPLIRAQIARVTGWSKGKMDNAIARGIRDGEISRQEIVNPKWTPENSNSRMTCYTYSANSDHKFIDKRTERGRKIRVANAISYLEKLGYKVTPPS